MFFLPFNNHLLLVENKSTSDIVKQSKSPKPNIASEIVEKWNGREEVSVKFEINTRKKRDRKTFFFPVRFAVLIHRACLDYDASQSANYEARHGEQRQQNASKYLGYETLSAAAGPG